jgi:hypothetical protein
MSTQYRDVQVGLRLQAPQYHSDRWLQVVSVGEHNIECRLIMLNGQLGFKTGFHRRWHVAANRIQVG